MKTLALTVQLFQVSIEVRGCYEDKMHPGSWSNPHQSGLTAPYLTGGPGYCVIIAIFWSPSQMTIGLCHLQLNDRLSLRSSSRRLLATHDLLNPSLVPKHHRTLQEHIPPVLVGAGTGHNLPFRNLRAALDCAASSFNVKLTVQTKRARPPTARASDSIAKPGSFRKASRIV